MQSTSLYSKGLSASLELDVVLILVLVKYGDPPLPPPAHPLRLSCLPSSPWQPTPLLFSLRRDGFLFCALFPFPWLSQVMLRGLPLLSTFSFPLGSCSMPVHCPGVGYSRLSADVSFPRFFFGMFFCLCLVRFGQACGSAQAEAYCCLYLLVGHVIAASWFMGIPRNARDPSSLGNIMKHQQCSPKSICIGRGLGIGSSNV